MIALLKDLIYLLYPDVCSCCGNSLVNQEDHICTNCLIHLPKTNFHKYEDNPLNRIFYGRVPLFSAASYLHYSKKGRVQRLIHQFKYKGERELGQILGRYYGRELIESPLFNTCSGIIPVPLHENKLRKRGFNQSELIARGLSESMNIPVISDNLFRQSYTPTQTRKSKFERWKNVEETFVLKNPDALTNQHLLLVDDVITTGATIEACASSLLKVNNVNVSVISLAVPLLQ
ncbi:MAG: ComF family protein [Bacteroidales bacterium]|nr:ComF family protein [Bacteroidales bacterium]